MVRSVHLSQYLFSREDYSIRYIVKSKSAFQLSVVEVKAISTATNQNKRKQSNEPMRTLSRYLKLASSAGKRSQPCRHCLWFTPDWLSRRFI